MAKRKVKATAKSTPRPSLLDYVEEAERSVEANKYCKKDVLRNEASVEEFFVSRLLSDLGYLDTEIRPKETLEELVVARGRKREKYKPDYAIVCGDKPRWIIDAKAPTENIDKWTYQGAGYAFGLNRSFSGENPCQLFVLTNGLVLTIFKWDDERPILSLEFPAFVEDDPKFLALRSLLGADAVRDGWASEKAARLDTSTLKTPPVEEVKRIFNSCHRLIWKAEKMSPQAAFFEFVKVMFVKLWQDRKLHEDQALGPMIRSGQAIPKHSIIFSTRWIDSRVKDGVANPIDTVLFQKLADTLQESVARGHKKPIFRDGERIELEEGTLRQVVQRLEPYDLFSIDEDLNGRLFEAFLSATMRGQALGQYFTPRSIVKLMERLAAPTAGRHHVDRVLDACCGTAGFLIEVLSDMRNQIRDNASLAPTEATALLDRIANESIFGIDAGREPPLARIARINMYLHGDGGSRIYAADSLDKTVLTGVGNDHQSRLELEELRALLAGIIEDPSQRIDIVLTNPPFAMDYSEALDNERRILQDYKLATYQLEATSRRRSSLRSSAMFIEAYADLLKEGGKLVTVIDDALLTGKKNAFARDYVRDNFILRAVISLPGDAFHRVGARAKTSVLYLVRRAEGERGQPDIFMYECQHVGLDDVPMKTRPRKAQQARDRAEQEIGNVLSAFARFLEGKRGPWLVPASATSDRLDAKWCLPRQEDVADEWIQSGYSPRPLEEVVDRITEGGFDPRQQPDIEFTLLRIGYDGTPERGDNVLGKELTYRYVQNPLPEDIVASNINAAHGAIGIINPDLRDTIISSEFTIMRVKMGEVDPWFLWGYLRSTEVRARLVSTTTGLGRHRVEWDTLKHIPVPVPPRKIQEQIGDRLRRSIEHTTEAGALREHASRSLDSLLNLDNQWAIQRVNAAKPPK